MKSGESTVRDWPVASTPAAVQPDGEIIIQVPNKYVARLVQLGTHALRAERQRVARRKAERGARRRNRSK